MGLGSIIGNIVGTVTKPFADVATAHINHKTAIASAEKQLQTRQVDGAIQLQLTDAEAEAIAWQMSNGSWKDEYITLLITLPIIMILGGHVAAVYGHPEILQATNAAISSLESFLVNTTVQAVIWSAIGLKIWRKV